MASASISPDPARHRAPKACQRCNRRKIKCDAATSLGEPCSRCRMDGVADCVLGKSRRGTYDRSSRRQRRLEVHGKHHDSRGHDWATEHSGPSAAQAADTHADLSTWDDGVTAVVNIGSPTTGSAHEGAAADRRSLASMFEDFLEQNDHNSDDAAAQLGIMLFGESSPLTFALRESNRGQSANLHDAGSDLCRSKLLFGHARDKHPGHCSAVDIAYLESKGALAAPSMELQEALVAAFVDSFYPLYAIVNKTELLELHHARSLPWILLHAVCFIGATFCDAPVIHRSGFKSRLHARRSFYVKVKVLFDTGYEIDKFILLQTTIMMTFWGPQMNSYWNPCSWVGFAVTIAESLGIHRSNSSADASGKDKGLVKRLWWTLVVRDSYCALLLGRPFRIDLSQCDTEMLYLADFRYDVGRLSDSQDHAYYQIRVAHLSKIARDITKQRQMGDRAQEYASNLHELLDNWHSQSPFAPSDPSSSGRMSKEHFFSTCLALLYHYHKILVHLNGAGGDAIGTGRVANMCHTSASIADSSAQMICSMASLLVTKHLASQLPHEVLAGFFVAGIVLYRQLRQATGALSQMARALLDNCQMLLNEVCEVWDPAHWVMRIFDFLLTSKHAAESSEDPAMPQNPEAQMGLEFAGWTTANATNPFGIGSETLAGMGNLYSVDWESPGSMPYFYIPRL